jgi:NADH-quinone oxidoreductase subunit N
MIIQVLGLIFNLYLVFLLISKNNFKTFVHKNTMIETHKVSTFSWLQHTSQDSNRLKILNRIGIL